VRACGSSTTPDQWEDFSNRNILETDKQCQNSAALRVIVDGVLQTASNDMRRQKEETDVTLARRIEETRDAKEKLEAHLAKVRPIYYMGGARNLKLGGATWGQGPGHRRQGKSLRYEWIKCLPKPGTIPKPTFRLGQLEGKDKHTGGSCPNPF